MIVMVLICGQACYSFGYMSNCQVYNPVFLIGAADVKLLDTRFAGAYLVPLEYCSWDPITLSDTGSPSIVAWLYSVIE